MEEFLPGLLKMIEERLGRKVAMAFLWLVVLGIGSWMFKLFGDNILWPVATLMKSFTWINLLTFLKEYSLPISIIIVLFAVANFLFTYFILQKKVTGMKKWNKEADVIMREIDTKKQELLSLMRQDESNKPSIVDKGDSQT